jgi:hypothetical protein
MFLIVSSPLPRLPGVLYAAIFGHISPNCYRYRQEDKIFERG